jgi:hypothetical protein
MLTDAERQRFAAIADVLIPEAEGMPSASQADVPTTWLDVALTHRPDLTAGLLQALTVADDLPPAEAIDLLNTDHIPAFEALGTLLAGAYYMNPEIKKLIGYPGQVPTPPKDDTDTYFDLLENVLERGQVYRDAPAEASS